MVAVLAQHDRAVVAEVKSFVATVYALRMGKFVANLALLAVFTVITVPWLIGIVWIIDLAADRVG